MNLNPIMGALLESADAPSQASGDYINPADGLKYCVKCRTPKEAFFPENLRRNGMDKHPVLCKCAAKARAEKESEEKKEQHRKKVTMLQTEAFRDIPAALWRFDAVPVMTAQLSKAKQYVENWDSFKRDEIGLLLFGDVGTGKTYAAGCIANALINK